MQTFIHILKLLDSKQDVIFIEIVVDDLPEGTNGKRFSRLKDGNKKRKYAIGKILLRDGRENCLIEIEREERSLSMLIVKAYTAMDWEKVCCLILLGLVNESGTWCNKTINKLPNQGLERKKHTDRSLSERAE